MKLCEERVLPEDYPVYCGYIYLVDDEVIRSDITGTVTDLKRNLVSLGKEAKEVKNCDIVGRGIV